MQQIEEAFLLKDVPGLPSFSHRLAASDVSRLVSQLLHIILISMWTVNKWTPN